MQRKQGKYRNVITMIAVVLGASGAWGEEPDLEPFLAQYCFDCHADGMSKGGFDLELASAASIAGHTEIWEKAIRRIDARQMPPPKKDRPSEKEYQENIDALSKYLDHLAEKNPNPGHVAGMRRLTRTEYQNAIRDLLQVEVDVAELLPKDESSHGFDNITVGNLSPTLLNRYISASQKISRIAVGGKQGAPQLRVVRLPADQTQEEHVVGLPLGTRGGALIEHTFPVTGEYEVEIRLTRDRDEKIEGLNGTHQIEVLVDNDRVADFEVKRPKNARDHTKVDLHLKHRIQVKGGQRKLGVTFIKNSGSLLDIKRQPYDAQYNRHRHPRQSPAVFQVSIAGPFYENLGEESPSRRALFSAKSKSDNEEVRAREILAPILRRAYRRSISEKELEGPMRFFRQARKEGNFDDGIERALSAVLVSPRFLFRIEKEPEGPGEVYQISEFELASRLSFFLWSSLPDEELLAVAEKGQLSDPAQIEKQVRRMLRDPRAKSLSTNFANQWLHLRNLGGVSPDLRLFPDFDDNLRQSFREETELFFQDVVDQDRKVGDLLGADYSFLNERLAKHYGIPHVYGSRFRKVGLGKETHRGGLLSHGSILSVTSYATRTSPVLRGNWILENILGTPAPPPPPNTPALDDVVVDSTLPMRARLAAHSQKTSCAACHRLMDPVGFALEHYDAVGRWRIKDGEAPVDADGGLPDGQVFVGAEPLKEGLLRRPDLFARTLTEKLLTYALGRGVEYSDAPAIRRIIRDASANEYRFSDLAVGIAQSVPFNMKKKP